MLSEKPRGSERSNSNRPRESQKSRWKNGRLLFGKRLRKKITMAQKSLTEKISTNLPKSRSGRSPNRTSRTMPRRSSAHYPMKLASRSSMTTRETWSASQKKTSEELPVFSQTGPDCYACAGRKPTVKTLSTSTSFPSTTNAPTSSHGRAQRHST